MRFLLFYVVNDHDDTSIILHIVVVLKIYCLVDLRPNKFLTDEGLYVGSHDASTCFSIM